MWDIFFKKNLHFTENTGVVLEHFWKNGQNVLGNPLYIYSYSGNDINTTILNLNEDLLNVNEWLISSKLTLNLTKTEYMLIGSRQRLSTLSENPFFEINGILLERVSTTKSLGVLLDENLTWSSHRGWTAPRKASWEICMLFHAVSHSCVDCCDANISVRQRNMEAFERQDRQATILRENSTIYLLFNLVPRLFLRGRKDPGRSWSCDVKKFDCLRGVG